MSGLYTKKPTFPIRTGETQTQGYTLHYREAGEGPCLVFLHGNPTSSALWQPIIYRLKSNFRCIAPDLIGYGQSEVPEEPFSFSDQYSTIAHFIEQLSAKELYLVGHDWGGAMATLYSLDDPLRVKGLILMETFPYPLEWNDFAWYYRYPWHIARLFRLEKTFFERWNLLSAVAPLFTLHRKSYQLWSDYPVCQSAKRRKCIYRLYQDLPFPDGPPDVRQTFSVIEKNLPSLATPVLLFNTSPGFLLRSHRLHQLSANLREVTVHHLGRGLHFTPFEYPKAISRRLQDWIPK